MPSRPSWARAGPVSCASTLWQDCYRIFILYQAGWDPIQFDTWKDNKGNVWQTKSGTSYATKHIINAVQDAILSKWFLSAQLHYAGKGLAEGFDFPASMKVAHSLKKKNLFSELAIVETVLSGSMWSPLRIKQSVFNQRFSEAKCHFCGTPDCDDLHTFWKHKTRPLSACTGHRNRWNPARNNTIGKTKLWPMSNIGLQND